MNFRALRIALLIATAFICGCGSNQLVAIAELGAPVELACGDDRFTIAKGQSLTVHEGTWSAGTHLIARVNGAVIEDITLGPDHAGQNLVWNVKGSSPVHAVDYTGIYGPDGKAIPGGPFKLLTSLEGKSLYMPPPCQLVNFTQPLPRARIGVIPVVRLVRIPKEAVATTLDDALRKELAAQLDVHGRLEFAR